MTDPAQHAEHPLKTVTLDNARQELKGLTHTTPGMDTHTRALSGRRSRIPVEALGRDLVDIARDLGVEDGLQ